MTKTKRDAYLQADYGFHRHYSEIWGKDRWENSLYPALCRPTRYAALLNRYSSAPAFDALIGESCAAGHTVERLVFPVVDRSKGESLSLNQLSLACYTYSTRPDDSNVGSSVDRKSIRLPQPKLAASVGTDEELMTHWNLDAASALAVHLMDIKPGDAVSDLCAAPGGKSVAISQFIRPQDLGTNTSIKASRRTGLLLSNEADQARYKRLDENMHAYIPAQLFKHCYVGVTNRDATPVTAARQLMIKATGMDKVLVDAPCSSERHIIHAQLASNAAGHNAPKVNPFRTAQAKGLAKIQASLLMTALKIVQVGGIVMYATCSLDPTENDGVVEKVLGKIAKDLDKGVIKWSVVTGFNSGQGNEQLERDLERDWAERTKYGWIVLPDHPSGGMWGPLFFVVLTKVQAEGG